MSISFPSKNIIVILKDLLPYLGLDLTGYLIQAFNFTGIHLTLLNGVESVGFSLRKVSWTKSK